MDFIDQLRNLSSRIANTKNIVHTEEATKNAMIMPFIQALGYNVFDPSEVTPELVADIGIKKGEKVDYAILKEGKPILLFECKKAGDDLNINHASQLFRYFHVTEARFAVITNGMIYKFYTDLEQPNKMDNKPFFEFNILDFTEQDIEELKKFTKTSFNIDLILATANELKYTRLIQNKLHQWLTHDPSEDFVKLLFNDITPGKRFTTPIKEHFSQITKRAFQELINNIISERLKIALAQNSTEHSINTSDKNSLKTSNIETTLEEIEAFNIIRAILCNIVGPRRVFMRDAQSYCAILLDDNNRKPICRLHFNNSSKLAIGLFNNKSEEKIALEDITDIFKFSAALRQTVEDYLKYK